MDGTCMRLLRVRNVLLRIYAGTRIASRALCLPTRSHDGWRVDRYLLNPVLRLRRFPKPKQRNLRHEHALQGTFHFSRLIPISNAGIQNFMFYGLSNYANPWVASNGPE